MAIRSPERSLFKWTLDSRLYQLYAAISDRLLKQHWLYPLFQWTVFLCSGKNPKVPIVRNFHLISAASRASKIMRTQMITSCELRRLLEMTLEF